MSEIVIKPELPIGTEFYFMLNNKVEMGIVAAYNVRVTSYTEKNKSWKAQLFFRWLNRSKNLKESWEYEFGYETKIDSCYQMYGIQKKNGRWFIFDKEIFFNKEDLLKSI